METDRGMEKRKTERAGQSITGQMQSNSHVFKTAVEKERKKGERR